MDFTEHQLMFTTHLQIISEYLRMDTIHLWINSGYCRMIIFDDTYWIFADGSNTLISGYLLDIFYGRVQNVFVEMY